MPFQFDNITISFYDHETEEEFQYFMGYDSGNDYTSEDEHMDKMNNDDPEYKEISEKIDKIREIVFP